MMNSTFSLFTQVSDGFMALLFNFLVGTELRFYQTYLVLLMARHLRSNTTNTGIKFTREQNHLLDIML